MPQTSNSPQIDSDGVAALRRRIAELEDELASGRNKNLSPESDVLRLRSLVEATSDWIWEVDRDCVYTYASPKVRDLIGYEPNEVIGKRPFDFMPPYEAVRIAELVEQLRARPEPFVRLVNVNLHRDGHVVILESSGEPILDEHGKLAGFRGIDRDITERKRAQDELSALNVLSHAISSSLTTDSVVTAAIAGVRRAVEADCVLLFLRDGDKLTLAGVDPESGRERLDPIAVHCIGECLCGIAAREGQAIFSSDIACDQRCTLGDCKRAGFHSIAALPIGEAGATIGVLALACVQPRQFEAQREFLQTLTRVVSTGLHNARLFASAARTAEDLRSSRQLLQAIIEQTSDAVYAKDLQGRYLLFNAASGRFVGRPSADVVGRDDTAIFPREEARSLMAEDQRVAASGVIATYEEWLTTADGQKRTFLSTKGPLFDAAGRITGLFGIARDVTDRKRAEETLRESEALFSAAFRSAPVLMAISDLNSGRYVDVNEKCVELTGFAREEVVGRTAAEVGWFDADDPRWREALLRGGGQTTDIEVTLRRRDGDPLHCLFSSHPVQLQGRVLLLSIAQDITARRRAEVERDRLFALSNDMLSVAGYDGHLRQVNPAWSRVLGWTAEELITAPWLEFVHPADREATIAAGKRLFEGRSVLDFENRYRCRDGSYRWLSWNSIPLPEERLLLAVVRDVTARKQAESDLKQSVSLLRATLESTADGILVVDQQGRIEDYNQRFAELWHFPPGTLPRTGAGAPLVERSDDDAIAHVLAQLEDPEAFLARVRNLYAHPGESSFDILEFKDGRRFERYSQPQTIDGRPVGRVWSFRDVTARKVAEAERARLAERMQQTQKMESLGVLAGGIAHDFNNLLTTILGNANLLESEVAPDSPASESLQAIEAASRHAAELCRQMLAYSGQGWFIVEPLDLSRQAAEIVDLARASVPRSIHVTPCLAENLPAVTADPVQLKQAVMNLVTNAAEAIGEREGTITITTGVDALTPGDLASRTLVGHVVPGRHVVIEVADTGPGMDASLFGRIFDPFFTTKFAGRGLGLSATLGIVRKHKGAVEVRSEPDRGSVFRILLPTIEPDTSIPTPPATTSTTAPWTGSGTVLVVDDDPTVRRVATKVVQKCGFRTLEAGDGTEAVGLFRTHCGEISCVILDLTMPEMDGDQVLQIIRSIRPDVPVIIASGHSESDLLDRTKSNMHVLALAKPYRIDDLVSRLREAVG